MRRIFQIPLNGSLTRCQAAVGTPVARSCGPHPPSPHFFTSLPCTLQLLSGNASHALFSHVSRLHMVQLRRAAALKITFDIQIKFCQMRTGREERLNFCFSMCVTLWNHKWDWGCFSGLVAVLVVSMCYYTSEHFRLYRPGTWQPTFFCLRAPPHHRLLPSVSVFKDLLAEWGRRIYKKLLVSCRSLPLYSTSVKGKWNILFSHMKCFALPPTTRF